MNNFSQQKITAIVQARTGSTRLPGKILKNISGKPMLRHVVERLSFSKMTDQIIIATTDLPEDNIVEEFCIKNNYAFHRGSMDDVLSRYYDTAAKFNADIIVRITSDCPLIDPELIDSMLSNFLSANKSSRLDYLSNIIKRTFPRGLDAEIFSFAVLEKTYNEAKEVFEREHVTPYIYRHPEKFTIESFTNEKNYSSHRWTVDTEEDLKLINEIYSALYRPNSVFYFKDILQLFEKRPELFSINQNVRPKSLGE
ncbi:MAG: glycosyltransferase family protein [Bacteroidetes bacterium]|nr:glycosyltransferase family protein [Bacteroidota bacterium]MCL6098933.1 glycosyltransferase family protein [Bacteroidota bacterium]